MLLQSSTVLNKMWMMTNPQQWHQGIMFLVVTMIVLLFTQDVSSVMAFSTPPLSSSLIPLRTAPFFTSNSRNTPAIRKPWKDGVSSSSSSLHMTFSLTDLPNPFNNMLNTKEEDTTNNNNNNNNMNDNGNNNSSNNDDDFVPTPEALVARAKLILATDLGINGDYDNLLSPEFIWVTPSMGSQVLDKTDYVAQGKFFNLRQTFPDLNYRPYDFRIDAQDPTTIRFTARTTGTMRKSLRLRNNVVLPANGDEMKCPPEAMSMTFDPATGQLRKLCSGFTLDRFVGNTQGLCGVQGAAVVAGNPPSDLEVYPLTSVVQTFLGRPTSPLVEPESFLAPFPETVMIQLAKGIISATMAADDPDLLSSSKFTFSTPTQGPVRKQTYITSFATQVLGNSPTEFEGHEVELTHLRVDPYDPYRVWVDVLPSANGYQGSPQAMSFTFDDDGFCERITAWAVMDPSIGNGGGLGGAEGYKYATGTAGVGIAARPLPEVLGRLQKKIFEPITNIGVDEFVATKKTVVPGSDDTTEGSNDSNGVVVSSGGGGGVPEAMTGGTKQTPLEKLANQAITPPFSTTTDAKTKPSPTRSATFKIPQIVTKKKTDTPDLTTKTPSRATTIKMPTFKISQPKSTAEKKGTTPSPSTRSKAKTTMKVPTRKIPPKQPPSPKQPGKKETKQTTPTRANTIKIPTLQIPKKKKEVTKGKPVTATKAPPPPKKKKPPPPTRSMTNTLQIPTFKIPSKTVEKKSTKPKKKFSPSTKATTIQMPTFSIGSRPTKKVQVPSSSRTKISSAPTKQKTTTYNEGASIIASVKRVQAEMAAEKQTKISDTRKSGRSGAPLEPPKKSIFSTTTEKVVRAASAKQAKPKTVAADAKKLQEQQEAKTSKAASKAIAAKAEKEYATAAKRAQEVASAAKAKAQAQAAERKTKTQAQAAERKAKAKAQVAERKARAEAQAADRKARAEAQAAERKAKAEAQVANRKAKAEAQAADRKAKVAAAAVVAEKKRKAKAAAQATKAQRGGTISLIMGQENTKKETKDDKSSTRAQQTSFPFFASTKTSAVDIKSASPETATKPQKKRTQQQQKQKQVTNGKAAAPKRKKDEDNKPKESSLFSFFGSSEKTPVAKKKKPATGAARASPPAKSGGGGGTFSLGSIFQQEEKTKETTTKDKKEKNLSSSSSFSFFNNAGGAAPPQSQVRPKVKPAPLKATKKAKESTKPVRATKSVPPKGVPVLQKWRQNKNGTISASISGSASFADGEIVTTSKIVSGELSSGSVVVTGSGSRYFLS